MITCVRLDLRDWESYVYCMSSCCCSGLYPINHLNRHCPLLILIAAALHKQVYVIPSVIGAENPQNKTPSLTFRSPHCFYPLYSLSELSRCLSSLTILVSCALQLFWLIGTIYVMVLTCLKHDIYKCHSFMWCIGCWVFPSVYIGVSLLCLCITLFPAVKNRELQSATRKDESKRTYIKRDKALQHKHVWEEISVLTLLCCLCVQSAQLFGLIKACSNANAEDQIHLQSSLIFLRWLFRPLF
jgi:hypothetical protein